MTSEQVNALSGDRAGVVRTASGVVVPLSAVRITGGLLRHWQDRNGNRTVPHTIGQLRAAGNVDNLSRLLADDPPAYRGRYPFLDTDLYKTLEGLAYEIGVGRSGRRRTGVLRRGGRSPGAGAGRGRLPELVLPGPRGGQGALGGPGLGPRAVQPRPPHPGSRRRQPADGRRPAARSGGPVRRLGGGRFGDGPRRGHLRPPRGGDGAGRAVQGDRQPRLPHTGGSLRGPTRPWAPQAQRSSPPSTSRTTCPSASCPRSPGTRSAWRTWRPERPTSTWRPATASCSRRSTGSGTTWSPPSSTSRADSAAGTRTRPSATVTNCRPSARTARPAQRSPPCSGPGACSWPPAARSTSTSSSGCSSTPTPWVCRPTGRPSSTTTRSSAAPITSSAAGPRPGASRCAGRGSPARAVRRTSSDGRRSSVTTWPPSAKAPCTSPCTPRAGSRRTPSR